MQESRISTLVTLDSGVIIKIYRRLFGGKIFYRLNRAMYFLSLRGLGIGNWETPELSGEKHFIAEFSRRVKEPVVLDIGANVGNYASLIKGHSPYARVFAFEPHPLTFKKLEEAGVRSGFMAVNAACGSEPGSAKLYDHSDQGNMTGTEHASMYKDVIEKVHANGSKAWDISVTTVDAFVAENGIERIDLLKIDVEGGELDVLRGAAEILRKGFIDIIHFEFNETNTISRVFMKDFYEILTDFEFYRMLPDGIVPLGTYYPTIAEIFGYQNVVAMRRGTNLHF